MGGFFIKMKSKHKFILKNNRGHYTVQKKVNGKIVYFGTYKSLRDAKFARDYFEENNWDAHKKKNLQEELPSNKRREFGKYIHQDRNTGKYLLQKHINRKLIYFGSYSNLEDTIKAREYFESTGWNPDERLKYNQARKYSSENQFISKTQAGYIIKKSINGKPYSFGSYSNLEDAKKAKAYFIEHDWDFEERLKFTKPRKKPKEEDLNKPYFQSNRLL